MQKQTLKSHHFNAKIKKFLWQANHGGLPIYFFRFNNLDVLAKFILMGLGKQVYVNNKDNKWF